MKVKVIQYGQQYGLFDADGEQVEGPFDSRHEAVEARRALDAPKAKVEPPKRGRKPKDIG